MQIKITHETLKALLIIAAKDDIRYYLKSVCVDVTDKGTALVACDGHRLLAVPVTSDDVTDAMPGEYIIPRESIAAIKPCKAGRVTLPLELTITKPAPVSDPARPGVTVQAPTQFTLTGITTATGTVMDAKYPDWRKVLPQSASGAPGQFNAEYLGSFGDVARLLTGNRDNNPVIHHNGTSGALVTIPGHAAIGVIMPWRIDADDCKHPGVPAWAK